MSLPAGRTAPSTHVSICLASHSEVMDGQDHGLLQVVLTDTNTNSKANANTNWWIHISSNQGTPRVNLHRPIHNVFQITHGLIQILIQILIWTMF